MTHYLVSATDPQDIGGIPVAEVEVDAENESDAILKAKEAFQEKLTTLDGLLFSALALTDD